MEDKRPCQVDYLPEELCRDILSRLPVKSLLRFRCVSKSWLSLIDDPDFCRVHLKKFKNNCDETHLLVVQDDPKYCVVRCSSTFETNQEILVTLPPSYREVYWRIRCSVNGLVLLVTSPRYDSARANDLILWNPSIRKFHFIPSLPEIKTPPDSSFREAEIGIYYDPLVKDYKHVKLIRANFIREAEIGIYYDPLVKDYKHVKLIRANLTAPPLVAIYTLGTGSWKISRFKSKEFSSFVWEFESIRNEVVYLGGSLYFLAMNPERGVLELVSFDLNCEEFCSISIPETEEDWFTLVRNECSTLALFYIDYGEVVLWVLEMESMSWTKPYSVDLNVPDKFLYLKKNSDVLIWWAENLEDFSLATSDKLEQWYQLVSSYNLKSKEEKIVLLQKLDDNYIDIHEVYGYNESLVLLK